MGMDVYGKSGNYFRATVWTWHPLWDLCEAFAPDITVKVENAHYNDGDGLGAAEAAALAEVLSIALDDGEVTRYIDDRNASLAALPDEECEFGKGSGTRTDAVGIKLGMAARNSCNGCDGKGKVRPFVTWYGVDVEEVREFRDFLGASGGFEIW